MLDYKTAGGSALPREDFIRSVRNFRLYGAFARERRPEEDGHDAYVHDEDPFAGGHGRTFDNLRSLCSAEKPGRQARLTGARDLASVVLAAPSAASKISCPEDRGFVHFAVRLNYLWPRLLFGAGTQEQEMEPRCGQDRGPNEHRTLPAAARHRDR